MKVVSFLKAKTGYSVSPDAMFDIQVILLWLNSLRFHDCYLEESIIHFSKQMTISDERKICVEFFIHILSVEGI